MAGWISATFAMTTKPINTRISAFNLPTRSINQRIRSFKLQVSSTSRSAPVVPASFGSATNCREHVKVAAFPQV
jgi:hypothetical protein